MTKIIHHLGAHGVDGKNASDGLGVDSVNYAKIKRQLAAPLRANTLDPLLESAREGYATFTDASGQVDENPGNSIKYCLNYSNGFDNTDGWIPIGNGYTVTGNNASDPEGGNSAFRIQYPDTTGAGSVCMGSNVSVQSGKVYRFSVWVRLASGELDSIEVKTSFSTSTPLKISGVSGEWQRLTGIISIDSNSTALFFTPKGLGCTLDVYEMQLTEGAKLHPIKRTLADIPLEVDNTDGAARVSRDGYLIEQQKENLCRHSQALIKWSLVGEPLISYIEGEGIFNGSPCVITFGEPRSINIKRSDIPTSNGEVYTVSFYAKILSGEIENASVSIGQTVQSFELTDTLKRYEYKLTAGASGKVEFAAAAASENPSFIITGVQIESEELSSYIPTSFTTNSRSFDRLNYTPSSFSALDKPFTFMFGFRNFFQTSGDDFLFNISGQFFVTASANQISLNNEGSAELNVDSGDVTLTYDGSIARVYINSVEVISQAVEVSSAKPEYLYICSSDGVGSNSSNVNVKSIKWWDTILTVNEMKSARSI